MTQQMDWNSEIYGTCVSIDASWQRDIFWVSTSKPGFLCKVNLMRKEIVIAVKLEDLYCCQIQHWQEFILLKVQTLPLSFTTYCQVLAIESKALEATRETKNRSIQDTHLRTVSPVMRDSQCSMNIIAESDFVLFYNDHFELKCKSVDEIRRMKKTKGCRLWPTTSES